MNGWAIFLGILVLILLILAIVFLVLWLTKRNKNETAKKDLAITGTKFTLTTPTTLTATWDTVGISADQVIMYADTKSINLDANGEPEPDKNPNILKSNQVAGTAKTVSISNLKLDNKYYIALVVTNKNLPGSANVETSQITTHSTPIPEGEFIISETDVKGSIKLEPDKKTVVYVSTTSSKDLSDLWKYDKTKFTLTSAASTGSSSSTILTVESGKLAAITVDNNRQTDPRIANTEWIYDNQNRWCLKNSPEMCMELEKPKTGVDTISVVANSTSKWTNTSVQ